MPIFHWKPEYNTDIKIIDAQHKNLVDSINSLFDRIKGEEPEKVVLSETLNRLIEYASFHFDTEERLLLQLKYPDLDEHKKEHEQCTKKILELMEEFEKENPLLALNLLTFLTDWLTHHILEVDKKYMRFLKENNLIEKIKNPDEK